MKAINVLFGAEAYLIEQKTKGIIQSVLDKDLPEFNLSSYDMRETEIEKSLDDAETLSFMGGKKVIVIKVAMFLTGEKVKLEHDLDRFLTYIQNPVEDSVLILQVPHEKLDSRKKIVKALKKNAYMYEAKPLQYGVLTNWVDNQCAEQGITISESANLLLTQMVGSNLVALNQEINKLRLYVGHGGRVEDGHVLTLVSRSLETDIFLLLDRVVNKRLSEAVHILTDLFKQNEEPIKILALLASQFRRIYQVKTLKTKGLQDKAIISTLKLHPYAFQKANEQSYYFDSGQLLSVLNQLADLDYKMKTGRIDRHTGIEMFISSVAAN